MLTGIPLQCNIWSFYWKYKSFFLLFNSGFSAFLDSWEHNGWLSTISIGKFVARFSLNCVPGISSHRLTNIWIVFMKKNDLISETMFLVSIFWLQCLHFLGCICTLANTVKVSLVKSTGSTVKSMSILGRTSPFFCLMNYVYM
jgi:hypothetical protein